MDCEYCPLGETAHKNRLKQMGILKEKGKKWKVLGICTGVVALASIPAMIFTQNPILDSVAAATFVSGFATTLFSMVKKSLYDDEFYDLRAEEIFTPACECEKCK